MDEKTKSSNKYLGCSIRTGSSREPEHTHKAVPELFLKDLALFADLLDKTPALLDPIDSKTFPRMVNAMSMLLGPAATMVVMMACHVNSAAFFENLLYAVQDEKSRGAVWIIQHLTALYGNLVHAAGIYSLGRCMRTGTRWM